MKYTIMFILLAAFTTACSSSKPKENELSKEEKDEGWKSLFDGKTLNGWRIYQNKKTDSWSVKDGTIYCAGSKNKTDLHADLITNDTFENFDLSIDWKISPQGNSGIMYMVTEDYPTAYLSGPEYQIIDDLHFPEKIEDWQKTGANYAMDPAPLAKPNAVGEWNHTKIVVDNAHVEHW